MNALYKLVDRLTHMLPTRVLHGIRVGAIVVWVIVAGVVIYQAWGQGSESAAQMGQDLSLAEIKARVERENNRRKPGDVTVPDLNELIPERSHAEAAFENPYRTLRGEADDGQPDLRREDERLAEPDSPVRGADQSRGEEGGAPFLGERELSPQYGERAYRPAQDGGVGGAREEPRNNATREGEPGMLSIDPLERESRSRERRSGANDASKTGARDAREQNNRGATSQGERRATGSETERSGDDVDLRSDELPLFAP